MRETPLPKKIDTAAKLVNLKSYLKKSRFSADRIIKSAYKGSQIKLIATFIHNFLSNIARYLTIMVKFHCISASTLCC